MGDGMVHLPTLATRRSKVSSCMVVFCFLEIPLTKDTTAVVGLQGVVVTRLEG